MNYVYLLSGIYFRCRSKWLFIPFQSITKVGGCTDTAVKMYSFFILQICYVTFPGTVFYYFYYNEEWGRWIHLS